MTRNIPTLDECKPGLQPSGFNVLVAVAQTEKVSKGGIILTSDFTEREQLAEVRGRIVAMSPAAFDFAEFPEGSKPRVGDPIVFAKFGGILTEGMDGKEYRLLLDKDVAAIITEEAA